MLTLPLLSSDGWVAQSPTLIDRVFAYFLLSDYSQTALYPNNITSLPYLIQQNSDIESLQTTVSTALTALYGRYYSETDINIRIEPDTVNSAKQTIYVGVSVTDDTGKETTLEKAVTIKDSKVIAFANINN